MRTIIKFRPQIAEGVRVASKGILVGDYLVVSYQDSNLGNPKYTIYNVYGTKLFPQISFKEVESAIAFAKWLDKMYNKFFPIWEEYPKADVFGLARWSVENGVKIYELLKNARAN